jgi:hypothetical protein
LLLFFQDKVSLCNPDWSQTQDPPCPHRPSARITDVYHYSHPCHNVFYLKSIWLELST